MPKFNPGDRVVANKTLVATVLTYDEQTGRLALQVDLGGGATDTIYGPISSYDLELLVQDRQTAAPEFDSAHEDPAPPAESGDEFTTLDNLS